MSYENYYDDILRESSVRAKRLIENLQEGNTVRLELGKSKALKGKVIERIEDYVSIALRDGSLVIQPIKNILDVSLINQKGGK
jgi:hypothetical protein